jgi:hypothetical protein
MGDRFFKGIRTYKPAVSRVLGAVHARYHVDPVDGAAFCPGCQEWLPIRRGVPPWRPSQLEGLEFAYLWCPGCGFYDGESWHSLTWSLPEARRFWQEHPRMRFLAEREIEVAGSPAIVTGFESLSGSARLEVVAIRDTCDVVSINGLVPSTAERG